MDTFETAVTQLMIHGHADRKLDSELPKTWQEMGIGIGVYVRMPLQNEPVFIAGLGRTATAEDIRGAMNFLSVLLDEVTRGREKAL